MATTKLRLHRDPGTRPDHKADEIPVTFRFPVIPRGRGDRGQAQRLSLVAGRLESHEAAGAPPREDAAHLRPPPLRLMCEDGTVRTPELVERIEQTLEVMQARLDRIRRHVDSPMRFPAGDEDNNRPTAA